MEYNKIEKKIFESKVRIEIKRIYQKQKRE